MLSLANGNTINAGISNELNNSSKHKIIDDKNINIKTVANKHFGKNDINRETSTTTRVRMTIPTIRPTAPPPVNIYVNEI